jgi:molybdopterin molybdotransferase
MLTLPEARQLILDRTPCLTSETISVAEASGRIARADISAPRDLPIFDTSAVDGYAIRSADVAGATDEKPVELRVTGRVAAGQYADKKLTPGTCQRIYTGAMLPPETDAIVMQEDTRTSLAAVDQILILDEVKPWENVRFHGEDIKAGAVVISTGSRLKFGHVAALSGLGIEKIEVCRQPVVSILATGTELCQSGQSLKPGQIYESNRATLGTLVGRCGGIPRLHPIVADQRASLMRALHDAFENSDAVVTIGGVSVGDLDLVRPVFEELGGVIDFWQIAIRPGKPFVFGRWKNKVLFGLPGNPVSAAVSFWLLGRPGLLSMQGDKTPLCEHGLAILGEPLRNRGDRPHFFRVRISPDGRVYNAGTQGSHILSSLAHSDGLVEVPPGTLLPASSEVRFIPWGNG